MLKIKTFMLKPKLIIPSHYDSERFCLLSYELPFLNHCFVICTHYKANIHTFNEQDFSFIYAEAQRLSLECVSKPDCFMIIFSGQSARRRANAHAHIFIIKNRWEKSLVYTLLASKNWGLTLQNLLK